MQIWNRNPDGSKGSIDLAVFDYILHMDSAYRLRIIAGQVFGKQVFGEDFTKDGELVVQLDPSDMARVAREYEGQVEAACRDLVRLVNSEAGSRKIHQKLEWIKRYWQVTDAELLRFLKEIETPIDVIRNKIAALEERMKASQVDIQVKKVKKLKAIA